MLELDQIYSLYVERKNALAPTHAVGLRIKRIYEGQETVPLPELERSEEAMVANLIQNGIDQHAMRIASVLPQVYFPPARAGEAAIKRAETRHKAVLGWWAKNKMPLMLRYRARDLIALSTSPVMLRPNTTDFIPRWHLRDPLSTYPCPGLNRTDVVPPDCIFAYKRSLKWIRNNLRAEEYGNLSVGPQPKDTDEFTCLEYVDADEIVLMVIGKEAGPGDRPSNALAWRVPNRAGVPLAVVPGRITISRLMGQFDQLIGSYHAQAKMWALQYHAIIQGIFGETWLEGSGSDIPTIHARPDPLTGDVGVTTGGKLQQFRPDPSFQALQSVDRLERSQRITGSIPAELGGESPTNVRTARRGEQVLGSSIDFPVQEHQEILAASIEEENKIAIALAKGYGGDVRVSFYVPLGRSRAAISYVANDVFESSDHSVSYAYAGASSDGLVIEGGQRVGMGTLSKQSFMELDPLVKDVDLEMDRRVSESIRDAQIASIQALAQNPEGPWQPIDLARLEELTLNEDMPLYKAIQTVQQEAQQRQAQMAPPTSPMAQPGLSMPGQGIEAIPESAQSQQNLSGLLASLRMPQMTLPSEAGGT